MKICLISTLPAVSGYGGGERTLSLLRALEKLGHVDSFVIRPPGTAIPRDAATCIVDHPGFGNRSRWWWRAYHGSLQEFRSHRQVAGALRAMHDKHKYDAFVSRYHTGLLTACWQLAPSFLDVDDVPSDVRTWGMPGWQVIRRSVMPWALSKFEAIYVTKQADTHKVGHKSVHLLPCISTQAAPLGDKWNPISGRVIVVGSMGWPPNRDGLLQFVERSWPVVRGRVPHATLRIIGAHPELAPKGDGVEAIGFAENLHAEYVAAQVVVCPVRNGAGATVKLAEAAGFGMPIAATRYATTGYAGILEPGRDLLMAEGDAELADACSRLLSDAPLRHRLGTSAAAVAGEHLSQAAIDRVIERTVGRTVPQKTRSR